jgi:hypothetical protein
MSETQKSYNPEAIIKMNKANIERIGSLVKEIADLAVAKTGGDKGTHVYQTYQMIKAYASFDHVRLLEKILEHLKSDQPVNALIELISNKIRETFDENI